jgi:hypothetical protein
MQKKTKIAAVTASALVAVVLGASTVIAASSTGIDVQGAEIPVIVSVSALVWWISFELMRLKV